MNGAIPPFRHKKWLGDLYRDGFNITTVIPQVRSQAISPLLYDSVIGIVLRAVVSAVMNLRVPQNAGKFLTS
jgi:hypothetical protein